MQIIHGIGELRITVYESGAEKVIGKIPKAINPSNRKNLFLNLTKVRKS